MQFIIIIFNDIMDPVVFQLRKTSVESIQSRVKSRFEKYVPIEKKKNVTELSIRQWSTTMIYTIYTISSCLWTRQEEIEDRLRRSKIFHLVDTIR